ncbi:MAG: ISAs1 family transposase, partial [Verrucomicrobia bacterium]|nr:ISAs1 family transposase [Verrucomicrobiota bacterium]
AKDWEEIHHTAEGMIDWLGGYVDVSGGIPSVKTLKRVISLLPTDRLGQLMQSFALLIKTNPTDSGPSNTIAIDGKSLRGCCGWNEKDRPLHLLHAWSSNSKLCIGQVSVDEKSNEITALPKLIELLEIKDAVITTDAMNTQKTTAEVVISKKADYILPVKENQPSLRQDIDLLFKEADSKEFKGFDAAKRETIDKTGGRIEVRTYDLLDGSDLEVLKDWTGCTCIGRVTRKRTKGGKTSRETCYYITSLDLDIDRFAKSVRDHWGIENGLHWSLDVLFSEDHHRYQDRIGAANLSVIRKLALAIVSRDTTKKGGRPAKMMRAATSPTFRDHLLKNCF